MSITKACTLCFFFLLPVFSSISLDLLPERAATLMVYEDVVEIVSGLQGMPTTVSNLSLNRCGQNCWYP